jgi:hypothetical protein
MNGCKDFFLMITVRLFLIQPTSKIGTTPGINKQVGGQRTTKPFAQAL